MRSVSLNLVSILFIWRIRTWCKVAGPIEHTAAMAPWAVAWAAFALPPLEHVWEAGPLPAVGDGGVV